MGAGLEPPTGYVKVLAGTADPDRETTWRAVIEVAWPMDGDGYSGLDLGVMSILGNYGDALAMALADVAPDRSVAVKVWPPERLASADEAT